MLIKNQDKEMEQLEYDLVMRNVEKEREAFYEQFLSDFEEKGLCFQNVSFSEEEVDFPLLYLHETGWYLFLNTEKEFTDLSLWEDVKQKHDLFLRSLTHVEEQFLTIYVLSKAPVSQRLLVGLYNPNIEFLTPIKNLSETITAELESKKVIFDFDSLADYVNQLESLMTGEKKVIGGAEIFSDATGTYIKKRGDWKRLSPLSSDRYFYLALYGGFLGIHKVYTKQFGSFFCYFFTLGFFGVGCFFDLLEVLLGVTKDKKKQYLGPVSDIRKKWTLFGIWILVVVILILFLIFLV